MNGNGSNTATGTTPFVQFMLTAVPAAIVVVAGWMFGNIFAELQHQRQRQENLVKEVTAINRDLISLTTQFVDLREFYRKIYTERDMRIAKLEKQILTVSTKIDTQQKEKELRAIKQISENQRFTAPSEATPNQ